MEEKNLIRKPAIEMYLKRFPILILMMSICSIFFLTVSFIVNTINSSMSNTLVKIILALVSTYIVFQLFYGLNKTLIRINNKEEVTNLLLFFKDAKSRIKAPLAAILIILLIAAVYIFVISLIGALATSVAAINVGTDSTIITSLSSLTTIIALFVTITKVIPYEFAFFILAEDENKSISGFKALKKSKAMLKNHIIDYIVLLLPVVGIFVGAVLILALFHRFVYPIFDNTVIYYGITIVLQVLITPLIRLIEINYYNYLKDESK